ncbi:MAG: NADH-quinone oxidoreductase subunit NuoN [Methylobacillus sp.]|nr:NADH-quinone oxidoreductase subunit NuoN [Methylobacillus sp.]
MNFPVFDLFAALPEIFVLSMGIVVLLFDLMLSDRTRYISYMLTLLTLVGAGYLTLATYGTTESAFHGLFVRDPFGDVLKLMIYLGAFVAMVYSRSYIALRGMYRGEFFALTLFAVLGTMIMVSGHNFITLYMGLELLSLCLYSLVALDRENPRATEAAMKYFVLGALASGMLLYGMSMIYGATGTLDIAYINQSLDTQNIATLGTTPDKAMLILGLVFVVAGIAFKLGAVPFQMWIPDVYHGAPTAVTMLVGSFPKFAAFAFAVRLLVQGLHEMAADWQGMLMIMAVLSIIVGNVAAIAQTNIKRMLAYSTISHIGFMLYGFFATPEGIANAMFYITAYVIMTLGAFGIIMLLSRKGFEADNLDDFKGLSKRSPRLAFVMLLLMFSMAGVPPTIGFDAKFAVLQAALQAGHVGLVIFAVLMATVGAFYYLRVVKLMYFDEPQDDTPIVVQSDVALVLGINGFAVLALGILPQGLLHLCVTAVTNSMP